MATRAALIRQLVFYAHRLADEKLVAAYDGNLSARTNRRTFLVTASGLNKSEVSARSIIEINGSGKAMRGKTKPSTETPMHLAVYAHRADVQAIVHAHPLYATAFATARVQLPVNILPEVAVGLGAVPLVPYATPSTEEIGKSILPFLSQSEALLLENHGAVTFGSTVREAYYRMEKLEHYARIIFLARQLGGEKRLTEEEMMKLREVSETNYGKRLRD